MYIPGRARAPAPLPAMEESMEGARGSEPVGVLGIETSIPAKPEHQHR